MLIDYPITVLAISLIVAIAGFTNLIATERRNRAEEIRRTTDTSRRRPA
jgi:hypothetical protein